MPQIDLKWPIFDRFIVKYENEISSFELKQLEEILNIPDNELLELILKKKQMPANLKNSVMKKIFLVCNASWKKISNKF